MDSIANEPKLLTINPERKAVSNRYGRICVLSS
jgi:hypothetical protein